MNLFFLQLKRLSQEAPEQLSSHGDLVVAMVKLLEQDGQGVGQGAAAALTHLGVYVLLSFFFSKS